MPQVRRSALVPYSAEQMFALVDDVATYPEFLPWCSRTEVESRTETELVATIEVTRGSLIKTFRTRNQNRRPSAIDIHLLDGPFRRLDGSWRFDPLGEDGCKVRFELDFEFESRLVGAVFGRYFEDITNRLVDAFIERADSVYANS